MEIEKVKELQSKISILINQGKYKESIEKCHTLLYHGNKLNDYKLILTAYFNLSCSYYYIGDIEETFKIICIYEETCDKYGDELDKLNLYNILFILYEYNKDFNKAKQTLEKTIALGKKINQYSIVANTYSNYSHIYFVEENYIEALEMGKVALKISNLHKLNKPILNLRIKLNITNAYIKLSKFKASKYLIDEMINDPILNSFEREKAQCLDLQSRWYCEQKLYKEAFQSLTYAKNIVEKYNDLDFLRDIQEQRCHLCEIIGDFTLGFIVQKEYISVLKEINKRELDLIAKKVEIKCNIASIERKAYTDHLTGIYNRDYLESTTNLWLSQAIDNNETISCILFDIDEFKSINDQYGHLFGDEAIIEVSKTCSSIIRSTDLIGRFGGDEFVIILKNTNLEQTRKKAEQILDIVRNIKLEKDGNLIPISISIGISDNIVSQAKCFNELFSYADKRLYKAKQNGKNKISE